MKPVTLQVGVKVLLVNNDGQFLFLKRNQAIYPGANEWDIPGGRIANHEPLRNALAREVLEETDLKLTGEPVLLNAQDIFPTSNSVHVVRLTYKAKASGTVQLSSEHIEYQWLTLNNALKYNIDPYIRVVLTDLKI